MNLDFDSCYSAVVAKDSRFDGYFYSGVTSTGIYCRPSCPAVTPKKANMTFHVTAAAAQQSGFRACKRCSPDASPGSAQWRARSDTAARAMRLISDGLVDRVGVSGLASHLGYSPRQLQRICMSELGAEPLALARAQRAHTARLLIETTTLSMTKISTASGFSSVRQFNDTVGAIYAATPTQLRMSSKHHRVSSARGDVNVRLAFRQPFHLQGLFGHLVATAVRGVESWSNNTYRRTMSLDFGGAIVELSPKDSYVACHLELDDMRDLTSAVSRCRSLLDLDADPVAIDADLARDPVMRRIVRRGGGRRIPGTVDAAEWAVRVVLGQQVSTAAARTHAWRLTQALGVPLRAPRDGLTHYFPSSAAIADAHDDLLAMPQRRRDTLRNIATLLAKGELDLSPGADRLAVRNQLMSLTGIGPWSYEQILMRGLGEPDAFFASDLGVLQAAKHLKIASSVASLERASERWRPWRSYAVQYLWSLGDHAINSLPSSTLTKDLTP